jgi:hypothetical protein
VNVQQIVAALEAGKDFGTTLLAKARERFGEQSRQAHWIIEGLKEIKEALDSINDERTRTDKTE